MPKFFNTTGPCRPANHYMLDPLNRLGDVRGLIDDGQYFVVHAPRQTGKTTTLEAPAKQLTAEGKYAGLPTSIRNYPNYCEAYLLPSTDNPIAVQI